MVIIIRLDMRSLAATIFLAASLYVLFVAGHDSVFDAALEISFVMGIIVCLYFSYRLILIVNDAN